MSSTGKELKRCMPGNMRPSGANIIAKVMGAVCTLLIEMITIRLSIFQSMVRVYSSIVMHGFFCIHRNQGALQMGAFDMLSSRLNKL